MVNGVDHLPPEPESLVREAFEARDGRAHEGSVGVGGRACGCACCCRCGCDVTLLCMTAQGRMGDGRWPSRGEDRRDLMRGEERRRGRQCPRPLAESGAA